MALNIFEELDLTSSGDNVDEGFLKCKNNWSDMDTELFNARDGEASLLAKIDTLSPTLGHYRRSQFTYVDGDTITVGGGSYDVDGTLAIIEAELTTTAHGVTGADWAYLYIDYSSLPSDNVLIQSDLIWATTEPAWSHTKLGWYNGSDRCIFACRIAVTSNDILEFYHKSNYIGFVDVLNIQTATSYNTSFAASSAFIVPVFSDLVNAYMFFDAGGETNPCQFYWRPTGSSATTGNFLGFTDEDVIQYIYLPRTVSLGTGDTIDIKNSVATATPKVHIYEDGYFLPEGI